jgi:FAD/FMN-containing dehydrogenase
LKGLPAGSVKAQGDDGFEDLRRNLSWARLEDDRRPAAIVTPADRDEVVAALELAVARDWQVGVRSGGHSWGSSFLVDGGLVLDLSRLDSVEIDAEARRAFVGPALSNGELVDELRPMGLAFPVGHCSEVALGGFLLAGGLGWNSRYWGPASMSVRSLEVVLADGSVLQADESRNPELLWLARGAGPGFPGVVTRFELELQPQPRAIEMTEVEFGIDDLDAVGAWLEARATSMQSWTEMEVKLARNAEHAEATITVTAVGFSPADADAKSDLGGFEQDLPAPALRVDGASEASFEDLHRCTDSFYPRGHFYKAEIFATGLEFAALLRSSAELFEKAPPGRSFMLLGVNADDDAPLDAAFSLSGRSFVACYAIWSEEREGEECEAWLESIRGFFATKQVSRYVGEANLREGPWHGRDSFSAAAWERVQGLRAQLDPDSRFVVAPLWDDPAEGVRA